MSVWPFGGRESGGSSGGRPSLADLEARQVEAVRVRAEREAAFQNAVLNAWSDVRSWGLPVWRGVARAGSAVALPFVAAGRVGRAVDASRAAGEPVGPAVRVAAGGVAREFLEAPGELGFGEVARTAGLPEVVGTVADVLAPGPDIAPLAKLAADLPPSLAFLLPLFRTFPSGTKSEKALNEVIQAINANVSDEPQRARLIDQVRDYMFRRWEMDSPVIYQQNPTGTSSVDELDEDTRIMLTNSRREYVKMMNSIYGQGSHFPTFSQFTTLPSMPSNAGQDASKMGSSVTRGFSPENILSTDTREFFRQYSLGGGASQVEKFGISFTAAMNIASQFGGSFYRAVNDMSHQLATNGRIPYLSDADNRAAVAMFNRIDSEFRNVALPASTTAYRGILASPNSPLAQWFRGTISGNAPSENLLGAVLPTRGFVSVSEDPSIAYEFVRTELGKDLDPNSLGVVFQMVLPQGAPALPLYGHKNSIDDYIGESSSEYEILLPRETGLRVVDYKIRYPDPTGSQHVKTNPYLFLLVEPVFSLSPTLRSQETP